MHMDGIMQLITVGLNCEGNASAQIRGSFHISTFGKSKYKCQVLQTPTPQEEYGAVLISTKDMTRNVNLRDMYVTQTQTHHDIYLLAAVYLN